MTAQRDTSECNEQVTQNHSDFSIEHILNRAGTNTTQERPNFNFNVCDGPATDPLDPYSWLQCTRYCPPKVPRAQKKFKTHKRQLGRHPRIPFTSHQLSVLEERFQQSPYLSSESVIELARQLHLADVRVKIWFQNRRARERREKQPQNQEDSTEKSSTLVSSSLNNSTSPVQHIHMFSNPSPHDHLSNYLAAINSEICLK